MYEKIIDRFVKLKLIPIGDKDIYTYGLDYWLSIFVNIVFVFLVAIFLHTLIETIIFLYGFISLRNFAGGYHAKTRFGCFITFMAVYLLSMISGHYLSGVSQLYILSSVSIISVFLICLFAPVCLQRNYEQTELIKLKRGSRIVILLNTALSLIPMISFRFMCKYSLFLSLGSFAVALSVGACKIIEKKGDRNETIQDGN
jgi:accessory gene regulator B